MNFTHKTHCRLSALTNYTIPHSQEMRALHGDWQVSSLSPLCSRSFPFQDLPTGPLTLSHLSSK